MKGITFGEAIEIIESLPEEQRESLIEIVRRRLLEERRERDLPKALKRQGWNMYGVRLGRGRWTTLYASFPYENAYMEQYETPAKRNEAHQDTLECCRKAINDRQVQE